MTYSVSSGMLNSTQLNCGTNIITGYEYSNVVTANHSAFAVCSLA